MPDLGANGPLIAALLQGQRQDTSNPFQQQRKYGQDLIIKGSSTAPLGSGSPLEGIARALQGGLGGVMAGLANRNEEEQNQADIGIMSDAAKIAATNPTGAADMLKGLKGNSYESRAMLGQLLQGAFTTGIAQQQAKGVYDRSGAGTTPATAPSGNGLVIDINKPTQVSGTMPPELEPHFQAAAQKYNLPVDLLKKAAGTESAFNPNAVSPAGAGGIMQLMPGTAGDLGVRNRFDSAQSIDGGANYLRQQLDKYGNIPHALAAYNWGPGNVDNWLKAGADPSKLPAETQAYIAKVAGGGQAGPQVAQAGGPPQGPQPSPPQIGQVPPSPEAAQFRAQEQQFARQGDYVQANTYRQKALEAEAKWASTLQQKQAEIGMQGAEHDRQQATATPNNEQALSSTFANRMHNSNQIIGQVGAALGDFKSRSIDSKVFGVGVPGSNYMVSPEYQQAKQARNDFINAQLRRESGAAISDSEYERADQQYFPQPGDGPDVLAQKAKNRQLAVEGMIGSAGPAFKMSPTVGAAPAAKAGGNELLDQAREAIRQGKDKAKVIEVLKANGGDPGQL